MAGIDRPGFIYVIHNPARMTLKIGFSGNPANRIAQLRTASPDPLDIKLTIYGRMSHEARLHAAFAHCRLNGEWFDSRQVTIIQILHELHKIWIEAFPSFTADETSPSCDEGYEVIVDASNGEHEQAWDLRSAAAKARHPDRRALWKVEGHEDGPSGGGHAAYYAITSGEWPDPDLLIKVATDDFYVWCAMELTISPVREDIEGGDPS